MKIALAAAGGLAGFLIAGPLGAHLGASAVMGAVSIGLTVGGTVGQVAFPDRQKLQLPLQDLQVSSSADGAAIPFGYANNRFAGQIIWAPKIEFQTQTISQGGIGGGSGGTSNVNFIYYGAFAVAFGEGPGTIRRVWADSKIIYQAPRNVAGNFNPLGEIPAWDTNASYSVDDVVAYPAINGGTIYQCIFPNKGIAPPGNSLYWEITSEYPPWQSGITYQAGALVDFWAEYAAKISDPGGSPTGNTNWVPLAEYYVPPTIYPGDENQLPDPTIQGVEGAAVTPAFRGLIHAVWDDFPLANFGNRIPNLRAEIVFGSVNGGTTAAPPTVYRPTVELNGWGANGHVGAYEHGIDQNFNYFGLDSGTTEAYIAPNSAFDSDLTSYCSAVVQHDHQYAGCVWAFGAQTATSNPRYLNILSEIPTQAGLVITKRSAGIWYTKDGGATWTQIYNSAIRPLQYDSIYLGAAQDLSLVKVMAFMDAHDDMAHYVHDLNVSDVATATATSTALRVPVGDIVLDVCKKAGIGVDLVDVSLLTAANLQPNNLCDGYLITRPSQAAQVLQVLLQAFFFDVCESDGKLKCIPRGLAPKLTIPESDLGLLTDKAKLHEQIGQEQDLPKDVTVLYNDEDFDYQQGKQIKSRNARIVTTKNQEIMTLPLTMNRDFARQIAEKALYLRWLERNGYSINLWQSKYMLNDPTDVVNFIYEGLTFQFRIVDSTIGQGFVVAMNGVGDNAANYLSSAQGGVKTVPGTTPGDVASPTLLFLFDIPLLRDQDANLVGTGYYYAMSSVSPTWPGGVLFKAPDDASFAFEDRDGLAVNFGFATNALPPPRSPWTWDAVNTLNVMMVKGTLNSDTELNVLNGSNALLVAGEVVQFVNAHQEMDGSYTLSKLLQARRGTDPQIGNHAVNDTVVDLHSGMKRVPDPLAILNQLRYYRGVTVGQDVSAVASQQFTIKGNDLKPYAPVHIRGTRDTDGNLSLDWIRRTRIGGDWLDNVGTVPLSETSELYDVDVLSGGSVVRSLNDLTSPNATYSAADQNTDFGSTPSALSVAVYQKSASVGRGFAGTATV